MKPVSILHLEDNAADSELALFRMQSEGMKISLLRVEEKGDFEEALHSGAFDLILSDFTLPNFDGLGALKLARRIRPDLPFIFLSGSMGEELAVESLKQGAVDYVLKGFLARLPSSVERALQTAEAQRERTRTDLEFRKSEARLTALIENSTDSIWSVDLDFRLMSFNSVARKMFKANVGADLR